MKPREPIDLDSLPTHQLEAPEPFEHDYAPTPWPSDGLPAGMAEVAAAIAKQVKAPEALAGFAVLHAVGHLAQRMVDARRPHDPNGGMPCRLSLLSLADSGDRKSECYRLATKPIIDAERAARQGHDQRRKALEAECAGKPTKEHFGIMADLGADPRTLYTDATVEKIAKDYCSGAQPALSWSSDEGGQFFAGHSMKGDNAAAHMGTLTRLYDGSCIERARVGDGSGCRFEVRFGFFLSAQPIVVRAALSDELLRSQGLLARFLLSAPASLKGTRFMTAEDMAPRDYPPELVEYWRILGRMNNRPWQTNAFGDLDLPIAAWTDEATEIWRVQFNRVEAALAPLGELAGISAFASRCGENAARIATIYAAWGMFHAGRPDAEVTADDMTRAWTLVWYSINEWLRYYQGSALSVVERDAKALLEFLQRDPDRWCEFTLQKIAQCGPNALRGSQNRERRRHAVEALVARRWLTKRDDKLHLYRDADATGVATATSATCATRKLLPAGAQPMEVAEVANVAVAANATVVASADEVASVAEVAVAADDMEFF